MVIYMAALQESQPNRLYIHGCRSRVNLDIYTVAVCPHKIAIFRRQPFKSQTGNIHCCRVYTKNVINTAAVEEPNRLYSLLPGIYIILLFTQQPFKSHIGSIHCCRVYIHKIVIYTGAIQEPNRLYTVAYSSK